jgi:hypothetical protein
LVALAVEEKGQGEEQKDVLEDEQALLLRLMMPTENS